MNTYTQRCQQRKCKHLKVAVVISDGSYGIECATCHQRATTESGYIAWLSFEDLPYDS